MKSDDNDDDDDDDDDMKNFFSRSLLSVDCPRVNRLAL